MYTVLYPSPISHDQLIIALIFTLVIAVLFTSLQVFENVKALFSIKVVVFLGLAFTWQQVFTHL